ncbi:maleylacetate reductase [Pseudonocardia endophytica]|uniref:Maleylacetate reductase n=1 Tax=Pseudonocardia endophytica TaxID=401976 RepID=A0A4R1HYS6_PSEEN|nr:maleylacetate reductase [Pseudonocardia endophytica]TCK26723.1 maleylacetate reductase [Pseudonocardia endophytica]
MTPHTVEGLQRFVHEALPMRVRFGAGSVSELPEEIDLLGLERVVVLCSPEQTDTAEMVAGILGDRCVGILPHARMHVPRDAATDTRESVERGDAQGCVAVGGGSAVGLGKAIALTTDLPVVALPTTYAGSEMTPIWGLTENGVKRTGRDRRVLPRAVVYDPELTISLPAALSVVSGINAVAHAVEGLYAPDSTPILDLMAAEGTRALLASLPRLVENGTDLSARAEALSGAWLCGAVLGATTMSLHHKICHVLGGMLDLPHAPTHTVVLPHVLAYNAPAGSRAVDAVAGALGGSARPPGDLWTFIGDLGGPRSLRELGMNEGDVAAVAEATVQQSYANPRTVTTSEVGELLHRAWSGAPPAAI